MGGGGEGDEEAKARPVIPRLLGVDGRSLLLGAEEGQEAGSGFPWRGGRGGGGLVGRRERERRGVEVWKGEGDGEEEGQLERSSDGAALLHHGSCSCFTIVFVSLPAPLFVLVDLFMIKYIMEGLMMIYLH